MLFFEKGYENIFLLSGGIEAFLEEFPQLVEGKNVPIPKSAIVQEEEKKKEERDARRKQKRAENLKSMH